VPDVPASQDSIRLPRRFLLILAARLTAREVGLCLPLQERRAGSDQIRQPTSVRSWVNTSLQTAESAKKVFSLGTSFDRFWQDGQNPCSSRREEAPFSNSEIGNRKSEMDQSLLTSAATLQTRSQNDLNGIAGWSPMRVPRKPATADRTGGEVLPTVYAAKNCLQ